MATFCPFPKPWHGSGLLRQVQRSNADSGQVMFYIPTYHAGCLLPSYKHWAHSADTARRRRRSKIPSSNMGFI